MTHDQKLNAGQKEAVETLQGPLLVLAGAGSGKTRVVTLRIAHLLERDVSSSQILGLTFTNKAANEMKARIRKLTQFDVLISTFHSLGARILRESIQHLGYQRDFIIYDEDDVEKLLKACTEPFAETGGKVDLKSVRGLISKAKNSLLTPDRLDGWAFKKSPEPRFQQIYESYQTKLKEYNAVDYDDLLLLTVRLLQEHPPVLEQYQQRWRYLLIDEYQDTNAVQYAIVNLLVAKHQNICVVGDPDQSIYSWRGANIKNILNFEEDYPGAKVVRLEQNYRSRTNILNGANAVVARNSQRYEKKLWIDLGPGEKIKHFRGDDEKVEAAFIAERVSHYHRAGIPLKEMAIFYRTNAQSRPFEDRFLQGRIPYAIVGGISFYQRREIKDILAWLRMVQSGADYISFSRTINLPKRGLGETTIEKIRENAVHENQTILSYCEMAVDEQPLTVPLKLTSKQKDGLRDYVHIIRELRRISCEKPLSELVKAAIELTHYKDFLLTDPETAADRSENLSSLVTKACEWEESASEKSLPSFLEELSLKSSLDDVDAVEDRLNMMTIHNGKGLEFPVVFLAGLEEELFPHVNSRESADGLEEERRLFYVGMTRAKEHLYLSDVSARFIWGVKRTQRPSRFIREIPSEYVEQVKRSTGHRKTINEKPKKEESDFIDDMNQTVPEDVSTASFNVGDKVFHQEFGIGHVRDVRQGSAGLTYQVFFTKNHSEKSLVAKYASLTKL